jgi:hypothetical protein
MMMAVLHLGRLDINEGAALMLPLIIITLVVFGWAAFLRTPEEKSSRHHHWQQSKTGNAEEPRRSRGMLSRLRRRRRRKERPRNPTLAETRGLPSLRGDESGRSRPD